MHSWKRWWPAPSNPAARRAAPAAHRDQAASAGYAGTVLSGVQVTHPAAVYPAEPSGATLADVLTGAASAAGGLVLAGLALYWRRIPLLRRSAGSDLVLAGPIQRFQSGVVNDYVTGIVIGLTCLGGALAFSIR